MGRHTYGMCGTFCFYTVVPLGCYCIAKVAGPKAIMTTILNRRDAA
jgi:hypothetical protein